jgi:hypothetical protein
VKDSTAKDSLVAQAAQKDSVKTDSLKTTSVKDSVKMYGSGHGFGINLFAGVNLYRTQSLSLIDERNVSPMIGMEVIHSISRHFEVGLGTWYSLQGGYNLADTSMQVSYFLEKNVAQHIILIHKQHRLYVPLTLYYTISDKHAVSGGILWSYLVNTVGNYYEMSDIAGSQSESQKDNVKGYMDGIKSSAFSFAAGYRYSLSKRFDLSLRIIEDLTGSYTKEYFNGVNTAPSWSMQTFVSIKF